MTLHEKIKELRKIQIREVELIGELRAFLKNHAVLIRKYEYGQKVEVFDENDQSLGIGIIDTAFCRGAYLESSDIKKFAENPYKWEEEINTIIYRVNTMKKDGTKGLHKLAVCLAMPSGMNNYIKPITNERMD
jgi:hypothetical protein